MGPAYDFLKKPRYLGRPKAKVRHLLAHWLLLEHNPDNTTGIYSLESRYLKQKYTARFAVSFQRNMLTVVIFANKNFLTTTDLICYCPSIK